MVKRERTKTAQEESRLKIKKKERGYAVVTKLIEMFDITGENIKNTQPLQPLG